MTTHVTQEKTQEQDYTAQGVRWDLSEIYPDLDSPAFLRDEKKVRSQARKIEKTWRPLLWGKKSSVPAAWLSCLREWDGCLTTFYRLYAYVMNRQYADMENPACQQKLSAVQQLSSEIEQQLLFISLSLKALPDKAADRLLRHPELAEYTHYIRATRRFRPYTLDEKVEQAISEKALTGHLAWLKFYQEYKSKFRYQVLLDGKPQEVMEAKARSLRYHPDRLVRQQATLALGRKFRDEGPLLLHAFNNIFKDHIKESRRRGYHSPISSSLLQNEITPKMLESMMAETRQAYSVTASYFRLKSRLLDLKPLEIWDLLAPLGGDDTCLTFEEARRVVTDAYAETDAEWGELVQGFFSRRYVEAEERGGKRGGAYCSSFGPSASPRVFLTYTGSPRDLGTLAHELGHALHFHHGRGQNAFNHEPSLPLCETASVFGEMLLTRKLLASPASRAAKMNLLARIIEDMLNTVFMQNAYVGFERDAYEALATKDLTIPDASRLWMKQIEPVYGDAVRFNEEISYMWLGIPHFIHTRFYCYAYTFGMLLSLSLYQQYEKEGPSFLPRFKQLLTRAGSASPAELVKPFGVRLEDPAFWRQGLHVIAGYVRELEKLA